MALNFRNSSDKRTARSEAASRLMLEASAILAADDDTVVSVAEHACDEPGCGARTVVLVLREGCPPKGAKIEKPIESVTRADLVQALASLLEPAHAPEPQPPMA